MTPRLPFDASVLPSPPADRAFSGPDYKVEFDHARLVGQMQRVYTLMSDSQWRTLREIAQVTGDPEASVSAQLRHLRKPRWGNHKLAKRRRGDESLGIYEYRLEL